MERLLRQSNISTREQVRYTMAFVGIKATPRNVIVPNMVEHEYPVHTVTRTTRIGCMIKMLDTATGELILAETIDGRHAHSDEVVAAMVCQDLVEPAQLEQIDERFDAELFHAC